MKSLLIIFLLSFSSAFGQVEKTNLSIDGNLQVFFGLQLSTPIDATIELLPVHKITSTDSTGRYRFDGLSSGTYRLRVLDYNANPTEFEVKLESKSIDDFTIIDSVDCQVNAQVAETDWEDGNPRLFAFGGIAPTSQLHQTSAEKKYGFTYYEYGCIAPAEECIIQYNKIIISHLDRKFGRSWREEFRKDIVGME